MQSVLHPSLKAPMVCAAREKTASLVQLLSLHRALLIQWLEHYGAVIFRGFDCQDQAIFSQAIAACDLGTRCSTKDYELPRTLLPNEIYTSSDLPGSIPLPLHHEKPRSKHPPDHLYFCCITPPQSGGGTIFANAAAIWQDMPESIQIKVRQHGVQYKQYVHGKSVPVWMLKRSLGVKSARSLTDYFGTEDKAQIETRLQQEEGTWRWANRGRDLILLNPLPGAVIHRKTGQTVWFNASEYLNYYSNLTYGELDGLHSYQRLAGRYLITKDCFPLVCHYGNGESFSENEIRDIKRVVQSHAVVFHWQAGDFMIVDNVTMMHGKQAHQGERLLYSCMTQLCFNDNFPQSR